MKKAITILLLLLPLWATAQTLSGTVTDRATGETLIGATVLDATTGKGTVTNAHGRYSLTLKGSTSAHLRVSFVGYKVFERDITLDGDHTVNAQLEAALVLKEV